ncbi:MAG TPA: helix-turn-helix domain-containing protein [Sphingomonadaceae bacterium]|nr:helix-turn-helix domain-containing protein [Sphingomonadaceae bacterium]
MTKTPQQPITEWSSEGLEREVAVENWRNYFAERQGTPVEVTVHEPGSFTARLLNRGVGQVRLIRLQAPAQRVVHLAPPVGPRSSDHLIHLIHALRGTIDVALGDATVKVRPGEAILIDNSRHYVLDMKTPHEAIDLIMPLHWIERHLPSIGSRIGKPISMRKGWAPPLASLMETITVEQGDYPVPRPLIAEQLGALLTLAIGLEEEPAIQHTARLVQQVMARIEREYGDPELSPDRVARELNISKRYLQSLLANAGTSFVRELTAVRLDRASEMLTESATRSLSVGEIAFRCGFLDPGYFTRQFRKRFDATPRAWRGMS